MLKRFIIVPVAFILLTSCASVRKPPPVSQSEFILAEASIFLDSVQVEFSKLYQDVGDLMGRIALLYAHPGWLGLEKIIRDSTTGEDTESDEPLDADTGEALDGWGEKWGESGEEFYSQYLNLVQQCTFLEVRRLALRLKLRSVEIRLVHALAMEATSKKAAPRDAIEKALDDLEALENQIDLYTINDLGLYEQKASNGPPLSTGTGVSTRTRGLAVAMATPH